MGKITFKKPLYVAQYSGMDVIYTEAGTVRNALPAFGLMLVAWKKVACIH